MLTTEFTLVSVDQNNLFGTSAKHPGRILKEKLDERGWTQEELAVVTGRHRGSISNIVAGKTGISADMAMTLAAVFGNEPTDWLKWDALYELSRIEDDSEAIKRMADLYAALPIRDMQKRGWIKEVSRLPELEKELEKFIGGPVKDGITFPVATRRTVTLSKLNAAEKAWVFRARQMAAVLPVAPFDAKRLPTLEKRLRQLAAFPKEIAKLPQLLATFGIRFVVVELLPNAKIDGAAFWIDGEPVIAVSVRHDRIDNFWFTVMHEFSHVKHNDAYSVDDLTGNDPDVTISVLLAEDDAEKRANDEAADILVPKVEMDSFVNRLSPLYPEHRVVQFAIRVKMHPGIVVGQLQRRSELGWTAHRHFLVKVRSIITQTALTDGWGQSMAPGIV
jgi:HTH-type transcriptional regulator/antitoxin HigA